MSTKQYSPLGQLILARLREFFRQPEVVFWVYGFPILMVVALGIAFRNKPVEHIAVGVQDSEYSGPVWHALSANAKFQVQRCDADTCRLKLRTGKTDLIVIAGSGPHYDYFYDPTRAESVLARNAVDDALQRAAGRKDLAGTDDKELTEPGARYIDFLVPGLLGMGLMGGGLWGLGFVIVDMRIRKLLKRFLATPMRKTDFLMSLMTSRFAFLIPEVTILLLFSYFAFQVPIVGSLWEVILVILIGAMAFSGLGLLIASRAKTIEAVSGLMNLVMVPMWTMSGIFFSSSRYPDAAQPLIKVLPLTALIDAMRAVMIDGASIFSQTSQIALLVIWASVTFVIALKI